MLIRLQLYTGQDVPNWTICGDHVAKDIQCPPALARRSRLPILRAQLTYRLAEEVQPPKESYIRLQRHLGKSSAGALAAFIAELDAALGNGSQIGSTVVRDPTLRGLFTPDELTSIRRVKMGGDPLNGGIGLTRLNTPQ